jgi:hypothetical protein
MAVEATIGDSFIVREQIVYEIAVPGVKTAAKPANGYLASKELPTFGLFDLRLANATVP